MGLNRLRTILQRHHRVGLDSSIFIYELEANPKYVALTDVVFSWLGESTSRAVTAATTMTEILVPPYRNHDQDLLDKFYGLLSTYPNLQWTSIDLELADIAARVRAQHNLRTPDALQAATALHAHATAFITNDAVFRRVTGFAPLILEDFV